MHSKSSTNTAELDRRDEADQLREQIDEMKRVISSQSQLIGMMENRTLHSSSIQPTGYG